jgi:hypothetical protein
MVQSNEEPGRPRRRRKSTSASVSASDLAEIKAASVDDLQLINSKAMVCFVEGRKDEALSLARAALLDASGRGGPFEAVVILSYLPVLIALAPVDTARQAAERSALLVTGRPGCEYLVSHAYYYALQVEIKAGDHDHAYSQANACIKFALRSRRHCEWLSSAWRYLGVLQALKGQKLEAIVSLANAVSIALEKPSDDPLVLARSHDAAGRIMMDLRKWQLAEESFLNALTEFAKHAPNGASEAAETWRRASKVRSIRQGLGE